MPAPATNKELQDVILKSGVIEDARLRSYLKKLGESPEGLPAEPSKLAGVMVRDGILTYFQADQLLQGKWKRFFIGKYKVLERLGVGGMGQVFLCEHKLMKRRVAVKVLPVAKAQDEAALSRFYREARAVASVDHPNIVRAYDIDQDENLHFIVMEFVDGANFHDLVKKHGPMDILRACHYMYGSAVGLNHAHEMGLVHRDIKPANILVDRSGVVKLLDMGLARFFNPDEDDMLTKKFDENVLGTADYLAPEQAIDSSTVDIRADIYGLGGTFYYMLSGGPPFPEGTVAQKLLWHQTKPPKSLRVIRPEIPEELEKIVNKMLAKLPGDRFQTPAELMEALAPWVQTPIPPPPEHEMPQLSAAASTGFATKSGPGSAAPLATGSSVYMASAPVSNVQSATQPLVKSKPPSAAPISASYAKPVLAKASAVAVAEGPAVWESLTSETLGNNVADTTNTKKKPKAPAKENKPEAPAVAEPKISAVRKNGSLLPWIIAASVGFLLVASLAGFTIYYVTKNDKNETEEPPPAMAPRTPRKWYVSSSGIGPDQQHTRKTIQDALMSARNGDTISILDDRIEVGPLVYGFSGKKVSLRIEAGNTSKNVVWAYKPPSVQSKPIIAALDLINLEDSVIDGFTFELGGNVDIGIRIQGQQSAGTTFQNLAIRAPRKTGIQFVGVEGTEDRHVKLQNIRIFPEKGDRHYENAMEFIGLKNQFIDITDTRLEGTGKGNALKIDTNAIGIEFKNNRVFNWDNGVWIPGKDDKAKLLALKISNTTFFTAKTAAVYSEGAISGNGRSITLEHCLFMSCTVIFNGVNPSPGVIAKQNGFFDSKEGNVSLNSQIVTGMNAGSARPELGNEFLRGINGIRPTIGKDKIPVGIE